jgi:hypothetical protein
MPSEMLQCWRKSQGQTHGDEKHLDEMVVACQVKCFSAGEKSKERVMRMKSTWMKCHGMRSAMAHLDEMEHLDEMSWHGLGPTWKKCRACAWNASWVIFHSVSVCPDTLQI